MKKTRTRRSRIEIDAEKKAKLERKIARAEKKAERERVKEEKRKLKLNPPTEKELVHKYVKRVITNQRNHGRVDKEKFDGIAYEEKENKNLWLDSDFYFSVVFESSEQKYQFLDAIGFNESEYDDAVETGVKIVNGIELAKKMNIILKREFSSDYPVGNLDLRPYVLDNEILESNISNHGVKDGKEESES